KLTDELISEAKQALPNVYQDGAAKDKLKKAQTSHGIKKMLTDLIAYSRGGEKYYHPAAQDTVAALRQQPEIKWTFHIPESDRVYNSRHDLEVFLFKVCQLGGLTDQDQIEMLLAPGTHRDHTRYPGVRWAA